MSGSGRTPLEKKFKKNQPAQPAPPLPPPSAEPLSAQPHRPEHVLGTPRLAAVASALDKGQLGLVRTVEAELKAVANPVHLQMFYAPTILSKKGDLGKIWLASHWEHKLTKSMVLATSIEDSVKAILEPKVKLSLRVSGHLLVRAKVP